MTVCGRYTLLREQVDCHPFALDLQFRQLPLYNIVPRDQVTIIRQQEVRECATVSWGLVPSWLKELSRAQINARAETLADKPMFRNAFQQRRCLIPADGYYEWQSLPERKQPWYIHAQDKSLLAFAGIWERYHASKEVFYDSCAIITTAANRVTGEIHDRMPVIVNPDHYNTWLTSDTDKAGCLALLKPCDDKLLKMWPVSTYVNNPVHKGSQCIAGILG